MQLSAVKNEALNPTEEKKMTFDSLAECLPLPAQLPDEHPCEETARPTVAEMKARQSSKIREIRQALVTAGVCTLNGQAQVLGLLRSTTWTILKARHKTTGLSATIINRMLASPQLPPLVRSVIVEYSEEKAGGFYGGSQRQRRKFAARVSMQVCRSRPKRLAGTLGLAVPPMLLARADHGPGSCVITIKSVTSSHD